MAKRQTKQTHPKPGPQSIKVGIVGLGRAGTNMHCAELDRRLNKFLPIAAADPKHDRRDIFEHRYGEYGARAYATLEELLADDAVELVSIASRSVDHVAHAKAALKAGKHVFLEKPIAPTLREARQLIPAAKKAQEKTGARLFIRHNRRFEPAFQLVREIIDSGKLGEVYSIKLRRHNYQLRADWQTIIAHGGGQLLNWGPHIIDHALQFLDYDVADLWSDLKLIAALGDAEDHLKIVMKNHAGRVVDLEISGGVAIREPEYIVFGTMGSLVGGDDGFHIKHRDPRQKLKLGKADPGTPELGGGFGGKTEVKWIEKTLPVQPKLKVDTDSVWDYMYDDLKGKAPTPITLEQAIAVMEVVNRVKKGTPFEVK